MRRSKLGAVSLLLLASAWMLGCHSGEIRLYKSRSMRDQVWMKKLDPDIFKTHEESVGLTLKISAPGGLASVTPGVAFVNRHKAEWNGQVQALLAQYTLLINDHNTAHITLEEYWQRRAELDRTLVKMAMAQPSVEYGMNTLLDYVQNRADAAFAELDQALQQRAEEKAEQARQVMLTEMERVKAEIKELKSR